MSGAKPAEAESEPEPDESALSTDVLYDILTDRRRRYTVHYLKQREGPVSIRDIAEQVAAWENRKPVAELDSTERKRVYISLYQSHLPSMDEMGLIEYDEDAKTVRLLESLQNAEIYIEIVPEYDIPWNLYYLGLSIANALLLGLALFEVRPFGMLPGVAVGAIVLATFALSALVQTTLDDRRRFGQAGPPPDVQDDG